VKLVLPTFRTTVWSLGFEAPEESERETAELAPGWAWMESEQPNVMKRQKNANDWTRDILLLVMPKYSLSTESELAAVVVSSAKSPNCRPQDGRENTMAIVKDEDYGCLPAGKQVIS
jgi:hypothetical protein